MARCTNCGSHVSDDYGRVFSRDGDHSTVDVCPFCDDKVRGAGNKPREARSARNRGGAPVRYDAAKDPTVAADGGESDG
jgi:hypothetical protein